MAAEQPRPNGPKTFTLAGKELRCFQAGEQMGTSRALNAEAQTTRKYAEHLNAQLAGLREQLLENQTYPMPADHPMRQAVEAITTLTQPIVQQAADQGAKAASGQNQASLIMGEVAIMDGARDARWRPPLRAWALLTLAMAVATTVATLAAFAFAVGW